MRWKQLKWLLRYYLQYLPFTLNTLIYGLAAYMAYRILYQPLQKDEVTPFRPFVILMGKIAVSYTHLDVYKRQFLDWGLMKDIFLPLSQQTTRIDVGGEYLVKLYIDERTGRIAATQLSLIHI